MSKAGIQSNRGDGDLLPINHSFSKNHNKKAAHPLWNLRGQLLNL